MKNLIIRNVPEDLHKELKLLAVQREQSLASLLIEILDKYIKDVKKAQKR